MKYLLLSFLAFFLLACQTTKQMATTDYNLLNGVWEGDCSIMVNGGMGVIECPMMETAAFTTILLNEQHEGIWVSQHGDNQPDTAKTKLIMRGKQASLQMEQAGKQWEREIFSVTQDSLKVYTSDKQYVALFRRKK